MEKKKKKNDFKNHIPCDFCDYFAPRRFHLERHMKAKHKEFYVVKDPIEISKKQDDYIDDNDLGYIKTDFEESDDENDFDHTDSLHDEGLAMKETSVKKKRKRNLESLQMVRTDQDEVTLSIKYVLSALHMKHSLSYMYNI